MERVFRTFREAAEFAAASATSQLATFKVARCADGWLVSQSVFEDQTASSVPPYKHENIHRELHPYWEPYAIPSQVSGPVISTGADLQQREKIIREARRTGDVFFCRQCGGDGGAAGQCPRCGGNGIEPSS